MNLTASPTVRIALAAASEISQSNSSSKPITSSILSRLSAAKSSPKLASSVTLLASTPRRSAVSEAALGKPYMRGTTRSRTARSALFLAADFAAIQMDKLVGADAKGRA